MSLDLTLMPLIGPDFWAAHQMIGTSGGYDLQKLIAALNPVGIPNPVSCFRASYSGPDEYFKGESCYGNRLADPYGDRLTFVTVEQLMTLKDHPEITDNGWMNHAAWAYLSHLPPDWKIVLYWH